MSKIANLKTGSRFAAHGSYSRVVAVDSWIVASNTAGRNLRTKEIPEDATAQTLQVFANIEVARAAVGGDRRAYDRALTDGWSNGPWRL